MEIFVTEWLQQDNEDSEYILYAFGMSPEGDSYTIQITNYHPYFFVEIPQTWNNSKISMFIYGLQELTKREIYKHEIVYAKPLTHFTGIDKFKYIKLIFNNLADFKRYNYALSKPISVIGLSESNYLRFESNISPMLRGIHDSNVPSIGWIKINKWKPLSEEINTKHGIKCGINDLCPSAREGIPRLKYLSFDIEADSSHADFPIANKKYTKLAREILVEFIRLNKSIAQSENKPKIIRNILKSYLQLAFNSNYANNGVSYCGLSVADFDFTKLDYVNLHTLLTSGDIESATKLLESCYLQKYDYFIEIVKQIHKECCRLRGINNVRFMLYPQSCLALIMQLIFDPNYTNCNFNNVYTINNEKPKPSDYAKIIKEVYQLCQKYIRCKQNKDTEGADIIIEQLAALFDDTFPELCGDEIIQIGSVFKRYGCPHPYLKHIITLNSCTKISNEMMIADENKDITIADSEIYSETGSSVTDENRAALNAAVLEKRKVIQLREDNSEVCIISCETEEELLLEWIKIVISEDPDIILGYNIFDFDYKYIFARAKILNISEEFNKIGKIAWNEIRDTAMDPKGSSREDKSVFKEQGLSSAAFGDNTLYYICMYGRISIDMYKLAQISFKLDSYKLDSVCKIYLGKAKNDLPPTDIFIKQKGTDEDRQLIAKYCLMDCILVTRLFDKLDIFINNFGMAQVCSVPFSYLFLRGQGIKLLSFVSKIAATKGYLLPVLPNDEESDEKYEGAIVLRPQSDIYFEPIVVADFNSLYPSCMISENLSHDSYVSSKIIAATEDYRDYNAIALEPDNIYEKQLLDGKYVDWTYVDIMYDIYSYVPEHKNGKAMKKMKKIISGHKICRFAQPPNGEKSIIPTILIDLLKARKDTRKKQGSYAKTTFEWNVLEGMQLAYKTTANSLYGQIGSHTSAIRLIDISACTTAVGRNQITYARDFCHSNYPNSVVVYGDTDSIFIKFETLDSYGNRLYGYDAVFDSMIKCTEAALCISRSLKSPHNLEMEKAIWPFILVTKKRYVGNYYTSIFKPSCYRNANGIALKRRDNAKILKHIFGNMIDIIMSKYSVEEAVHYIKSECYAMLRGGHSIDYFIFSKTLRSYYKNPTRIAHKVLADRIGVRDPGNKPRSNDRIHYAFIINKEAQLQGDKIETPEFITSNKLCINYELYLTNQLEKPISQIIELYHRGSINIKRIFENIKTEYQNDAMGVRKLACYSTFGKNAKSNGIIAFSRKALLESASNPVDIEKDSSSSEEEEDELELL